ncbi:MAG TPA: hypothetical protein PKD48_01800 [Sphingopyxis sp.]|nr:hypothetical protein [Sphingopyxis sp.]
MPTDLDMQIFDNGNTLISSTFNCDSIATQARKLIARTLYGELLP